MIISIVSVTALAVISVAAIAGALVVTMRDGYGRVPTRRS
jgi:uncharacterized membrane protein